MNTIIAILILSTLTNQTLISYGAGLKVLTMDEAVMLALKNSPELIDNSAELVKKEIELKQANEAIRDIRKKESTVRFSLLFNIQFPEEHGLPKEIDLQMKVPTIQSDIRELKKKKEYLRLSVKTQTELIYMDTLLEMGNVEYLTKTLENNKKTLERIEKAYKLGQASKNDVDFLKKEVETTEKQLRTAIMNFENKKEKLSERIGLNIKTGYEFDKTFSFLSIERNNLQSIIDYAVAKDFDLYRATEDRKVAEIKVENLRGIYTNRWGSMVGVIEQELKKNGQLDYEDFLRKYHKGLDNIADPWKGSYKINLLFFTIKIPKEWFMKEYSGLRYFEDEKYALFVAVIDRDKAVKTEENTRKELIQKVKDSYNTLKTLEIAYLDSKAQIPELKKKYENALKKNKLGELSFGELESIKKEAEQGETTAFNNLIEYNKSLSTFNEVTSGFIDQLKKGKIGFDRNDYASGDSFADQGDEEEVTKPEWFINTPLADYKWTFGVKLPKEIKATHFVLLTKDNLQIGEKTDINATLSHVPITYNDSTLLVVELYNEDKKVYRAYIDGGQYGGELELEPVEESNTIEEEKKEEDIIGTWDIQEVHKGLVSSLGININDKDLATHYEVYGQDSNQIGERTAIGEKIHHLPIVFSDIQSIEIKLFKDDEPAGEAYLEEKDGQKLLKIR